jgi:hypothetical protein
MYSFTAERPSSWLRVRAESAERVAFSLLAPPDKPLFQLEASFLIFPAVSAPALSQREGISAVKMKIRLKPLL